jgi:DNA-binding PadR family transcriptional regulator
MYYGDMSLKFAILGVLSIDDCHGYQLKLEAEQRLGIPLVNVGQIYSTLDRLERDLLVAAAPEGDPASAQAGRIRYRISDAGREALAEWLQSPLAPEASGRDELANKLALASTLPGVQVQPIIRRQRMATLGRLQLLTTEKRALLKATVRDLPWQLNLDRQVFALEAELRWLDHVEGLFAVETSRGLSPVKPEISEGARRGRPTQKSKGL